MGNSILSVVLSMSFTMKRRLLKTYTHVYKILSNMVANYFVAECPLLSGIAME